MRSLAAPANMACVPAQPQLSVNRRPPPRKTIRNSDERLQSRRPHAKAPQPIDEPKEDDDLGAKTAMKMMWN